MQLLVIGIDAVSPNLVFDYVEDYPNLKKLIENGTATSYDGYVYGYGSHDNWISMYTGVSPKIHKVIKGRYQPTGEYPKPADYAQHSPIWEVLNDNGLTTGIWKGLATTPPVEVDGYMISGEAVFEYEDTKQVHSSIPPVFTEKNQVLKQLFEGDISEFPYPPTPGVLGTSWEKISDNPEVLNSVLEWDYFREGLEYFKQTLEYSIDNIKRVVEENPVDVFWFYDPVFDYIGHFQMHDKEARIMREALKYVDKFIGELIALMSPENCIFLSDHGQRSIIEFFPNCDTEVRKEAFGLSNISIFTEEVVIMKGRNPGFLSTLHDLKGIAIFSGERFKQQQKISYMRTLDIYPTILELLGCKIPSLREGYVLPILNKEIGNTEYVYPINVEYKDVLFIQTCQVNEFNTFINEYYFENRFHNIYVAIDMRYEEVFKVNMQVKGIFSNDEVQKRLNCFSKVIVPYFDQKNSIRNHIFLK